MQTQASPRLTGLWRNPDFLKLWAGQTVSEFGSLLPTLGYVAILLLDATPFQVALLEAANTAPGLLFALFAGVWVDRLRRRSLLIAADLGRALLLGFVAAAFILHLLTVQHLFPVAFAISSLTVIFNLAYRSYLPSLVRREQLLEANSKLTAGSSVVEFSAFSLGGWLVQWFSVVATTLIDAGSFLVSALSLAWIRTSEDKPTTVTERRNMAQGIGEGLQLVWRHRLLRTIVVSTGIGSVGGGMIGALIGVYGLRELAIPPGILGMIWGVGGLTSTLGALYAGRLTRRIGIGPALVYSSLVASIGTFFIPLAQGPLIVAALLLVASQLVNDPARTIESINEISLRQAIAPDRLLGRVNSSMQFVELAGRLGGSIVAAVVAALIGVRLALTLAACLGLLASVWLLLSPVRTLRDLPTPVSQGEAR